MSNRNPENIATNKKSRFQITIDQKSYDWEKSEISGREIRGLARVDNSYSIWQILPGEKEDPLIEDADIVDISKTKEAQFFTGKSTTTEGSDAFLPCADDAYLQKKKMWYRAIKDGGSIALIIKNFSLPKGHYDQDKIDLLIILPPGYPDVSPDMFYMLPWVKLNSTGQYPAAANEAHSFDNREWQRWSRHENNWPAGAGISLFLQRIQQAIKNA